MNRADFALGTIQSPGTAQRMASSGLWMAAKADPEPFSKAALTIAAMVTSLFGVGPDPRNVPDTQNIEAAQIALNNLWNSISGENFPTSCIPGRCGAQRVAIFATSAYPNVPKGPMGDLNIDIDQAIQQANAIIADAKSAMRKPGSLRNPFFAPGGGSNIPGLLAQMKAARTQGKGGGLEPVTATGWGSSTDRSLLPAGAAAMLSQAPSTNETLIAGGLLVLLFLMKAL